MSLRLPGEDVEKEPSSEVSISRSQVKVKVKSILDLIRATPLGSGFLALNLGLLSVGVHLDKTPFMVAPVLGVAFSWKLASNQLRLRRRLEEIYAEEGYSDRLFKPTTREWCDRQVGRVVTDHHGHLEDYVRLCKENESNSSLTWLPNF